MIGFDHRVVPGGYAWWYLDAVSDDGAHAVTVIAFIGSVFSPNYARARRRMASGEPADPERFCAINVAVYSPGGGPPTGPRAWALTEHAEVSRSPTDLQIGRSSIAWATDVRGSHLRVDLDERATRFFGRPGAPVRGQIRLYPSAVFGPRIELDRARAIARHRWYPVAPHARVEVELDEPRLRFSGSGYHDVNEGDEGLEDGFVRWNWSRAELDANTTAILYDAEPRDGPLDPRGWLFSTESQTIEPIDPASTGGEIPLAKTRWRVDRATRSELGHTPKLIATLEDTPFYSRNLVKTRIAGRDTTAIHESLSLDRFGSRGIQFLLRFKTATSSGPRRTRITSR